MMADSTNRSVRILVVDSDVASGRQLCEWLFREGYSAEFTSNAARALVMARRNAPTLMIVDASLDGSTGHEFAQTVRSEYPHHDIPVIFTSARDVAPDAMQKSRAAGGLYFLSKPIDCSVLLELVDKSLWMPHLVRRHIENQAHEPAFKSPRMLHADQYSGFDL